MNASGHPYLVHGQSTGGVPVDESNGGAGNTVTNNGSLSVSHGSYNSEFFAIDARSSGADGDRTNENNGSPGGNLAGVLATAIGGVGGSENDSSGGKGGAGGDIQINLTNEASISTTGANAYEVLGQSIGAPGGNGGDDTSLSLARPARPVPAATAPAPDRSPAPGHPSRRPAMTPPASPSSRSAAWAATLPT